MCFRLILTVLEPLFKVPGLVDLVLLNQSLDALGKVFLREALDVVLEGIRDPAIAHPDPGFTLVVDPVLVGKIEDLVEVLVVREDHVTTCDGKDGTDDSSREHIKVNVTNNDDGPTCPMTEQQWSVSK